MFLTHIDVSLLLPPFPSLQSEWLRCREAGGPASSTGARKVSSGASAGTPVPTLIKLVGVIGWQHLCSTTPTPHLRYTGVKSLHPTVPRASGREVRPVLLDLNEVRLRLLHGFLENSVPVPSWGHRSTSDNAPDNNAGTRSAAAPHGGWDGEEARNTKVAWAWEASALHGQ